MIRLLLIYLLVTGCAATQANRDPADPAQQKPIDSPYFQVPNPSASPPLKSNKPLKLSLEEAVVMALENNGEFQVKRFQPPINQQTERQQAAVFHPNLDGTVSTDTTSAERLARAGSGTEIFTSGSERGEVSADIALPTGTRIDLAGTFTQTRSSLYNNPFASTRIGLTVTQSLLQGFGPHVNLVALEQAQLTTKMSEYELRGFAEAMVAKVEQAYWDYAFAQEQVNILTESLKLAEKQLADVEWMIASGKRAGAERIGSQSEVALRHQELLNAKRTLEQNRLRLLQQIQAPQTQQWGQALEIYTPLFVPLDQLDDVEAHVTLALKIRADLSQARLALQKGNLEIVKTGNGLLPKLDVFTTLGKTGYASALLGTFPNLLASNYDISGGINFSYPIFNQAAEARHQQAIYTYQQSQKALENMEQLVQLDIRTAYVNILGTRERIEAVRQTLQFQQKKLEMEIETFKIGKSSSLLIAQAQRDLLQSQLSESQALVNHLKALTDFFRLEGTLLERRGIVAPGHRNPKEVKP